MCRAYTITQGGARQKSLAVPWATLLPLRGLTFIFIGRGELEKVMRHFDENPVLEAGTAQVTPVTLRGDLLC